MITFVQNVCKDSLLPDQMIDCVIWQLVVS